MTSDLSLRAFRDEKKTAEAVPFCFEVLLLLFFFRLDFGLRGSVVPLSLCLHLLERLHVLLSAVHEREEDCEHEDDEQREQQHGVAERAGVQHGSRRDHIDGICRRTGVVVVVVEQFGNLGEQRFERGGIGFDFALDVRTQRRFFWYQKHHSSS